MSRSFPTLALILWIVTACSSPMEQPGGDGGPPDPDGTVSGDACVPYAEYTCSGGNVHWIDSCGTVLELVDECVGEDFCQTGLAGCCRPALDSGAIARLNALSWLFWTFPAPGAELIMNLDLHDDPGTGFGMAITMRGDVGTADFYIALQNRIGENPDNVGKGVLMSRFGTNDPAQLRVAPNGGYSEIYPDYIGVRNQFNWTTGQYTLRLTRKEPSGNGLGDWFDLYIGRTGSAEQETHIGGIVAPRANPSVPATIATDRNTAHYNYYIVIPETGPPTRAGTVNVLNYGDLPNWSMNLMTTMDGEPPKKLTSSYPTDDLGLENLNTETRLDGDTVFFSAGSQTDRCTPAGDLIDTTAGP